MQSARVPVTYVPTPRGWVQAPPIQPSNSQAPPIPAGFNHDTWRTGNWQANPRLRAAPVQGQAMWLPHPAWYPRNAASGLSAVDVERVPWLWVPQGVDVRDPAGYPASWRGHSLQTPQLESEVTLPPSLPISPAPGFPRVRVSERFLNGRDSPHPHPGRPLPMDDDYDSSPDYGHFRADASPRLARASSPPHTREGPRSNTYSSFATPESTMSPPDIPPSSSSYYPSDNYPSGSSRSHTLQRSSDQLYPGSAPRHNPLPPPPEHHPLAQSLLQKANRPTASDARNQ